MEQMHFEEVLMELQNNKDNGSLNNMIPINYDEKLQDPVLGKRIFDWFGPQGADMIKQEEENVKIEEGLGLGEEMAEGSKKQFVDFGIGTNYGNNQFFSGYRVITGNCHDKIIR